MVELSSVCSDTTKSLRRLFESKSSALILITVSRSFNCVPFLASVLTKYTREKNLSAVASLAIRQVVRANVANTCYVIIIHIHRKRKLALQL